MASLVKRKPVESKASKGKRKRRLSGSDEEGPAFLSSKYAEPPVSKIYNSHFRNNTPAELFRKDLISAMKLPDSEPLTPEDFWPISDSWKPEWEKGVQVPVNPEGLPEPNVKILRNRRKDSNFKIPKKLLHLTQDGSFSTELHILSSAAAHAEKVCQYDMDDTDMQWLNMVNEEREDFGLQPVEERVFELIMEELEAMCYDNFQEVIRNEVGLGSDDDDDAICDVCRSPDSEEGNEMVFCDSCNICVHQACYGITKIPEGSWICRTCALGLRPSCVLCPNKGGAMKSTRSGEKWAHVSCALWIPEVTIGSVEKMEPIIKISQIPVSRWTLVCSLCKEKIGACIQCSVKFCKTAYHVTCAFEHGLQMKAILEDNDDEDGIKLQSYCPRHSKKRIITSSDSEPDFVIQQENARRKKELQMTSEEKATLRQQKIQERESQFYNYVDLEEISGLYDVEDDVMEMIMNYWKLKRKANFNRPLLPPKAVNHNSSLSGQNSKYGFIEKILNLRQDLERARNLCYMVSKREKLSRSWIKVKQQIFQKQHEAMAMNDENSKLTKEEVDAVLLANHGDRSYDKKYTGLFGPSPIALKVLTVFMGQEPAKVELSKICKPNKKNDKSQSQKLPKKENNPYAKHYLNGLLKRSQRWLASIDRQKMVANPQSFKEFSSSQYDKSDTNSHFGDVSKNSISTSDLEGFESLPITNDSDLSFLDFSETAARDNESVLPVTAQNAGDKCFSGLENHTPPNNANKDNHRSTEKKVKGYLGSSSMKSLVSSQIKRKTDVSSAASTPKLADETSKSQNLPSVSSELGTPILMEPCAVKCEVLLEADKDANKVNKSAFASNDSESLKEENNSSPENTAFINQLSLKKKNKVKQEHSVYEGKGNSMSVKHRCENNTEANSPLASQKVRPAVDKSEDLEMSSKINLECKHKVKYLNGKKNRSSSKVNRNSVESKDSLIKDDSGSLHVYNDGKKLNSGKEIVLELTPISKVMMDIEDVNVPEVSSEVEASLKNECDSPVLYCDVKDINVCQSEDAENKLHNVKSNKRRKNDSSKLKCIEEEVFEGNGSLEADESSKNKKSAVLSGNSKCNKYQKNKMSSNETHLSDNSTVSSHSSPHSVESDGEHCRNRKKNTSGEVNSVDKVVDHVKVETSDTHKSKALSSSELKPSLSSVNKPHTTSSSMFKLQTHDSSELKDNKTITCNKVNTQVINSTLPSKGSLSGYKIPKKVKTLVEESSLEKKRGSSPLSPLAECMSSTSSYPSNSYQVRHSKPWRSNQRNQQKCPNLRNGETESQSQRLVIKLKKDPSDPDSQRWKTDSTYGDRKDARASWADDMQPVPNIVQRRYCSPDSRQWTRMPGIGCNDPRLHDVHYGSVPHMT